MAQPAAGASGDGTAYRIRTDDLRLERAVSWASRRMRHGRVAGERAGRLDGTRMIPVPPGGPSRCRDVRCGSGAPQLLRAKYTSELRQSVVSSPGTRSVQRV